MYKNYHQVGPFDPSLFIEAPDIKVQGENVIVSVEHSQTRGTAFFYCDTNLYYRCYTPIAGPGINFIAQVASFYVDSQNALVGTGFCTPVNEPKLNQWNFKTVDYKSYPKVFCELAGITEANKDAFAIRPNPCSELINIADPDYLVNKLSIFNINGQELYTVRSNGTNEYHVNVSQLLPGLYNIILQTNAGLVARRFLKE